MADDRLNADADENVSRAFKTAVFARSARKARIRDSELCEALREVMAGQADDLGGGVFKKRLNKNMHRSVILAKGGRYWIYEYLFAKKDRDNIDDDELRDFKLLAKGYASLAKEQIDKIVSDKDLLEICDGDKA
ncbi:type II toxin-antitoxin system RelE/ParE family toxin [Methylorubrum extorquens]